MSASGTRRPALSVSKSLQLIAGVLLAMILAATAHQVMTLRGAIVEDSERQLARLDMVFAEQTGRAVETVDFILRSVIEADQAGSIAGNEVEALMRRRIAGVRQVSALALADASGNIVHGTSGANAVLPPAGRAALTLHAADPTGGLSISLPFRGADGAWTALLTRAIPGPSGSLAGIGLAWLNLDYFEDFYRAVELNENGSIILHLRDGTVLARFPHVDAAIGTSFADTPPFKDILSHTIAGTLLMESPIDGSIRVTAIRALRAFPLAVMVSVEQHTLLAGWRHEALTFAAAAAAASLLIVGLLLTLAHRSAAVERANRQLREQMAERERAEAALRQAQRIEAVGQLTGGVAHDFNNLLTVLAGNIDLLQNATEDVTTRERLAAMRAAADRGAELTGHLLAFARRQPLLPRAVDLNVVVGGMQDLLQSALGGRVRMELQLADGLWPAMVDPTQIELVILNLAINARDAMPDGGRVTIATANRPGGAGTDDFVVVTVRDEGTGMTPEVQAKAFEPFFTTKGPRAGSGLGLSQVFGTARQSGGDVHIDSAPGKGTSVSVSLPRAASPAEPPVHVPVGSVKRRDGRATVLIVDDDEAVRATTAEILQGLGYAVTQAGNGQAALDLLTRSEHIDALLTDVVMPGVSGPELARYARERHPSLPIIFMSGYAEPEGVSGLQIGRLVRKPFRASHLREQIEKAMEEMRTPAG